MGQIGKTIFSICLLMTLVFLTVVLCWMLSRQSDNIEYIIQDFERKSMEHDLEREADSKSKSPLNGQCKFGIDFVLTSLKSSSYVGKRYRLPNHANRNFTGTLLGQDLMCLDTMDADEGEGVGIFECHGQGRNQALTFTRDGLLVSHAKKPMCISVKKSKLSLNVVLKKCNQNDQTQIWSKDSGKGLLIPTTRKDYCLTAPAREGLQVQARLCKNLDPQKWRLVMNEVMLLWVEGAPTDPKTMKMRKNVRKHLSDMILHARHIERNDALPYLLSV